MPKVGHSIEYSTADLGFYFLPGPFSGLELRFDNAFKPRRGPDESGSGYGIAPTTSDGALAASFGPRAEICRSGLPLPVARVSYPLVDEP